MRIVGNDPTLSRQLTATASGAISAAGKPLIVNTDGTVQFAGSTTFSTTVGSSATFESAAITGTDMTFDSNSNRVVISYQDGNNSDYGTAIVGEVNASNNTISFGTPVVFESAATNFTSIDFDSTANKVLIAYEDDANSDYGTAIVGTVDSSDNSISFGSAAVFESAATTYITTRFDPDNSKFLIVYEDEGNSQYGTAVVATISGTSVSFGTPTVYASHQTVYNTCIYDTNANKFLVVYRNADVGGYGIVATISGTSVSFGSATGFHTSGSSIFINGSTGRFGTSFDSTLNKIVIAYQAYPISSSTVGYVVVGTISGTSVSFGSYVALGAAEDDHNNIIAYDSSTKKHLLMNYDASEDPDHTNIREITVSGTTPTVGDQVLVSDLRESTNNAIVFDSNAKKMVIAYAFGGNSNYGTANVIQTSGTVESLTTENFIGTSAHSAADGAKVLVNTQGAIDENQSGLTAGQTFFVDKNGALQLTTADIAQSVGSEVVYEEATAFNNSATFDSNSNRIVIAYGDVGNSSYGTAVVGTVSGTSVTFGTPVVFESASVINNGTLDIVFDSNNNKIVVGYSDGGNSEHGTAIVGTVDSSDNSISFGSPTVFESAGTVSPRMDFDTSNNKVVITYADQGNSNYLTAIVGTVSGTSISFGTASVVVSGDSSPADITFDNNSNKFSICYPDASNNYGRAKVATVSGTSISFGSEATFASATSRDVRSTFDSSNNKVIIIFEDGGNSNYATAIVGTISGTDITFGSEAVIFNGALQTQRQHDVVFNTSANKVVHAARDNSDSNVGKFSVGTVSGTDISFTTPVDFNSGSESSSICAVYNSTENKIVIGYRDQGNSNYGTAIVLTLAQDFKGSLSTDAVTAGTALSATKLLVKG